MLRSFQRGVLALRSASQRRGRKAAASRWAHAARLSFEPLEGRLVLGAGPLVISEFMADNKLNLADADGDYSDWIEIHNPTDTAVDLDGWRLTDDPSDLAKWRFPHMPLEPGGYLVVFASNKDRRDPTAQLHTNFKLDKDGEYLALVQPDRTTVADALAPKYPPQSEDVSYGRTLDTLSFVAAGSLLRYQVPTSAQAALGTTWTERNFDDSAWSGIRPPPVLVTEMGTGTPDWLEIENVGPNPVNTTGWTVAVNDATSNNINAMAPASWRLGDSIAPNEVLYRTDDAGDHYWGSDIFWRTSGNGWVMIVDAAGNVVDSVVWGYGAAAIASLNVTISGHQITATKLGWEGASFLNNGTSQFSLQRGGAKDHDTAADWSIVPLPSRGAQNVGLSAPFPLGDTAGLGFSTNPAGFDGAIQTNVQKAMKDVNASLWTRVRFPVDELTGQGVLRLRMKYNDGFVAYLNGTEIARRNAPDALQWNSTATATRTYAQSSVFEDIDVSSFLGLLTVGTNVLAIQGLNNTTADGDFVVLPELLLTTDVYRYMDQPTPREPNNLGVTETPVFSQPSGTYVDLFYLTLSVTSGSSVIRYTTDGSIPGDNSPLYTRQIQVNTTSRIRARAYDPHRGWGPIESRSYIFLEPSVAGFSSNLPLIVLDTFNRSLGDRLLTPVSAVFIDIGSDGRSHITDTPDFAGRAGLRIRGQSSEGYAKKQYAFEVWDEGLSDAGVIDASLAPDKAVSLFGLPSESDWVIQGPYNDKAMMRNYLSYTWGRNIGMYAPRVLYAEAFLNTGTGKIDYPSDYIGTYLLIEKIKIDKNRVDITPILPTDNQQPEITGGFIYKKDKLDDEGGESYWYTSRGQNLLYQDPKVQDITPQQHAYLLGYINEFETVLYGPNFADPMNGYAKYIDVDSFIDNWIMVEMVKNIDGFRLSTYYHKDRGGKIKMGPLWDADLSLGNADYLNGYLSNGWYCDQLGDGDYPYWRRLYQDPNFKQRLADRWTMFRQGPLSSAVLLGEIDRLNALLSESQVRNFAKWTGVLGFKLWPNWYVGPTWQSEVDWMRNWFSQRLDWMDAQFVRPVSFSQNGGVVQPGFQVTLTAPAGTIYYTLDGSDPRLSGGGTSPQALAYSGNPLTLNETTFVKARARNGNDWSAPMEADFFIDQVAALGNLVISELNYNPLPPTAAERAINDTWTGEDFEFIELLNTSSKPTLLRGAEFTNGITFAFPPNLQTPSPVLITEVSTGAPDFVEIENVSGAAVNTSGWVVAANDGEFGYINAVVSTLWTMPSSLSASQLLYKTGTPGDNYWGEDLAWPASGKGWVMIVDGGGQVVDFVVWGYSTAEIAALDVTIGGRHITAAGAWNGAAVAAGGTVVNSLQRLGKADHDSAADWAFLAPPSKGAANSGLAVPFMANEWQLEPGAYVVLVRNEAAFRTRYGGSAVIAGQFSGKLDNNGETLTLADRFGNRILSFRYGDGGNWPGRADGNGSTLELIDPMAVPRSEPQQGTYLASGRNWRSSSEFGGSPGFAGKGPIEGVVINEVLSHSDLPLKDAIELMNTSGQPVDVGGWFISDSSLKYDKFRIPTGTVIPAGGYLVFTEDDFNPTPQNPGLNDFAFNGAHGDDAWLCAADGAGKLTYFVDHVELPAARSNESLGRWPNGSGDLYPMLRPTFDPAAGANAGPRVGPLVLSELNYLPKSATPDDFEFVEIYNPTGAAVDLTNWQLAGGIDLAFPAGTTLAPHAALVVVPFVLSDAAKLAAFRSFYGIGAAVQMVGGYTGRLSDNGEKLRLERPDAPPPGEPNFIPHTWEDAVDYAASWYPTTAGNGQSLNRAGAGLWGQVKESWAAAAPSPGVAGQLEPRVAGRHVFYNGSAFDGNDLAADPRDDAAIAVDKRALLPGQTAAFANYTSYSRGLNGIMVDIAALPAGAALDAADFAFRVGNSSELGTWVAGAAPSSVTLRPGAGVDGSDRVTLLWPDNAIQQQWLQVTVLATADTGLAAADVFYFGNAIGESGDSAANARVDAADVMAARNNPRTVSDPAAIDFAPDYNRDARVNAVDMLLARRYATDAATELKLITMPGGKGAKAAAHDAVLKQPGRKAGGGTGKPVAQQWDWLYELDQAAPTRASAARAVGSRVSGLFAGSFF